MTIAMRRAAGVLAVALGGVLVVALVRRERARARTRALETEAAEPEADAQPVAEPSAHATQAQDAGKLQAVEAHALVRAASHDRSPSRKRAARRAAGVLAAALTAALVLGVVGDVRGSHGIDLLVDDPNDFIDLNPGDGVCAGEGDGCSLRAAVMEANALSADREGHVTIAFDVDALPEPEIVLTLEGADEDNGETGDLDVTGHIEIGAGVEIDGNLLDRIFDVHPGAVLDLRGITLVRGAVAQEGGAIRNRGTLDLRRVQIGDPERGNFADDAPGGALYNGLAAFLEDVAIVGNSTGGDLGGGIYNVGNLTVQNTTISGNEAVAGGGLVNFGNAELRHVTLADNVALGGEGANVLADGATTFWNSILVVDLSNGSNCAGGSFEEGGGFNLVAVSEDGQWLDDGSCGAREADVLGEDPRLDGLADHGGPQPTLTHALLEDSPAIDRANTDFCLRTVTTDQRGVQRPQGEDCDIGAFELEQDEPPPGGLVVNTTDDEDDGECTVEHCSLREALNAANATPGLDTITFDIPGEGVRTIFPATPLPPVTDPVVIDGYSQPGASENTLDVGSDAVLLIEVSGESIDANAFPGAAGIELQTSGSTVQGLVINDNFTYGIAILGQGATSNLVRGNFLGTDPSGDDGNGFRIYGVLLGQSASDNVVGGTEPGDRNVISGTTGVSPGGGVGVGLALSASSNSVVGNYIGTNAAGTAALANATGVFILSGATGNVVGDFPIRIEGVGGGDTGNLISGNGVGVRLQQNSISNRIDRNWIGLSATGGALGNTGAGVDVAPTASSTSILGNTIAHNGGPGVGIAPSVPPILNVSVLANSIFSNGALGIDLGNNGVTPNDAGDVDVGPNNLQNFPDLVRAGEGGIEGEGGAVVSGRLASSANTEFLIEFFASPSCDPSGHGEGMTRFGSLLVETNSDGLAGFVGFFETVPPSGSVITATATGPSGTSEFSRCIPFRSLGATDVSLTVDMGSIPAGAHTVPLDAVPADQIPLFFIEGAATGASVPVGGQDVDSAPLGRIPLGRIPLGRIPLGRIPLGRIGLDTGPEGTLPLQQILLSSIPVAWDAIIAPPSPNAGRPLQALTLADVYDDPTVYGDGTTPRSRFEELELGESGLDRTLLRGIGLGALALGDVELDAIDPPPPYADWCVALSDAGGSCAGVDTSTNSLVGLSIAGAPLGRIPLGRIPLGRIPLGRIPLGRIPLGRIDIASTRLADILIADLASPTDIVDCTLVNCGTETLGDAFAASAIKEEATLADLAGAIGDELMLADVLLGILPRSAFPWEAFPLDGVQLYAGTGDRLRYHVDFDLDCGSAEGLEVNVKLPTGYIALLGTTEILVDEGMPAPGPDPETDTETGATWSDLPDLCGDGEGFPHVRLSFDALSAFRLGTFTGTATVRTDDVTRVAADEAPTLVTQNHEANDDPETAPIIEPDTLVVGHVARAGDLEIFRLPIPERGTRTTIFLSHIAEGADFDLAVGKPEAEPLQSAPLGRIPLGRIPIEDRGSSLEDSDQALPPETLNDIPLGRISIGSISANRGNAMEVAEVLSQGEEGYYTIIVAGYNGSHSDLPFVLRAAETPPPELPPCPPRNLALGAPGSLPAALPATTKTIFLVNKQRMAAMYGVAETDDLLDELALFIAERAEVAGEVLEVDGNAAVRDAYATWDDDPCSIEAANDIVRKINDVVASYRPLDELENVVLLGADEAIPMARVPDLVTLAPEFDEAFDLEFTTKGLTEGNALYASAATGHVLTDYAYVAFTSYTWLGRELYLPQASIGRLVEAPEEIKQQLLSYVDYDGTLDPATALTTAYDFLSDGGEAIFDSLELLLGQGSVDSLINDTWHRNDLLDVFTGKTPVDDILSVNAHYNHYALEPAGPLNPSGFQLADLVTTADLPPAVEDAFSGRVLYTMGCHGGLNVADILGAQAGDEALLHDWPQAYGQLRAAVYVANTGFGYGDTEANALSERLMTLFSGKMGENATIGADWRTAVHEYFGSAGFYGVYDEKVMIEATFYGLPFWRIAGAGDGPEPPEELPVDTETFPLDITVPADDLNLHETDRGTFRDFRGESLDIHYRPIQPRLSRPVPTVPGKVAHGAIITALVTEDEANADPVLGTPTIDLADHEPEKTFEPIFFPANLVHLTRSRVLGDERQSLVLIPGQFRPGPTPADNRQRLVRSTSVELFYADDANEDFTPPEIQQVGAFRSGAMATVFVETRDEDPAGIRRVAALVNDGSGWRFLELARLGTSMLWTGQLGVTGDKLEIAAQSQDMAGNVGYSTNKGENFDATEDGEGPEILIDSPLPIEYGLGVQVNAEYHCSDPGGVATCVGDVPSGAPIDTSVLGEFTFTVTATDLAGHQTTKTVRYSIVLGWTVGFFLPPVSNPPEINSVRAGSTVPLKWQITDATGAFVRSLDAVTGIESTQIVCPPPGPENNVGGGGNDKSKGLKYDLAKEQFVFAWATDKDWRNTCRRFTVTFADGTERHADFRFK